MSDRIKIRRDSAARWVQYNPILSDGEIALESDTNQIKIGNGLQRWVQLEYVTGISGAGGTVDLSGKEVYQVINCVPNQVTFFLSYQPINSYAVRMNIVGGIELVNGIDYLVSNNEVSYIATAPSFEAGDQVVFKYFRS